MVIPQEYREFFTAAAGASGALIGLLFVAITVSPERARHTDTRTEFRVRASTALLVFSNALSLSLAALIPQVSLGWWCLVSCLGMLAFAFATTRSWIEENRRSPGAWRPLWLVCGLLLIVGFEVWAGVRLVRDGSDLGAIRTLDYVVIADLLMGIARAWQLASMRETGLLTSLRVLASGQEPTVPEAAPGAAGTEPPQPPSAPPTEQD